MESPAAPERGALRSRAGLLSLCLLGLALYLTPALAHKVNMFAFVEGDKVLMEGYFSDGKRPMNSDVTVTDPRNKVLLTGKTDDEGKFSFKVPAVTDLHVTLDAGMGHKTEYVVSRAELEGLAQPSGGAAATSPDGGDMGATGGAPATAAEGTEAAAISETMVRRAVAEATLPLMRAMDELKESERFSNIVGGIGFIVGIVGVFFYVKARKLLAQSSTGPSPQA